MWTCNLWRVSGFLAILAGGAAVMKGESPSAPATVIPDCTVRFVHKSTYATSRPGIIAELPFEEGDRVQPGDLVVRLRDEVALANLKLRKAQALIETPIDLAKTEQAAADLALHAALEANRLSPTAFSKTELERLRLTSDARALQVQQAREELNLSQVVLEQAEAELESYRVHARFGGLVTRVYKHVGEAVNLGDEILTIVDTTRVRVEGTLPYAQVRRLQVGDPVRVQLTFPEDRTAQLERLTSAVEPGGLPQRKPLPEETEVFVGRIGFIDVETGSRLGLKNEVRVWAEVLNRDNVLLEGLPAVMKVLVSDR